MPDDTDELIRNLRECDEYDSPERAAELLDEAADRLSALQARNAELARHVAAYRNDIQSLVEDAAVKDARNAELKRDVSYLRSCLMGLREGALQCGPPWTRLAANIDAALSQEPTRQGEG